MMGNPLNPNGVDLKDTLALSSRVKALEVVAAPERNSEAYAYFGICVLASTALYFGLISEDNWMLLVGGAAAFYGTGRVILKKGGENI